MGADMVAQVLAVHRYLEEGEGHEERKKAAFKAIHDNIEKATAADQKLYLQAEGDDYEGFEAPSLEEQKEEWHSIVSSVEEDMQGRETTYWFRKDEVLWITGGLSWGDSPTNAYDDFAHFANLPDWITKPLLVNPVPL